MDTNPVNITPKPPMTQEEITAAYIANGGFPKEGRNVTQKLGAPSDYDPKYCHMVEEFFNVEPYREVPETWYNPDGSVKRESVKLIPNPPAHTFQFCQKIGISSATFYNWCRQYPDFLESVSRARAMRKAQVINNGLSGLYNPLVVKLCAANWFDWHDKQETHHTGEVKNVIVKYHKPEREKDDNPASPRALARDSSSSSPSSLPPSFLIDKGR